MQTITTGRIKSKCIMHAHITVEHELIYTARFCSLHYSTSLCTNKWNFKSHITEQSFTQEKKANKIGIFCFKTVLFSGYTKYCRELTFLNKSSSQMEKNNAWMNGGGRKKGKKKKKKRRRTLADHSRTFKYEASQITR